MQGSRLEMRLFLVGLVLLVIAAAGWSRSGTANA